MERKFSGHTAVIAECDADDNLNGTVLASETEEGLVRMLNGFFSNEAEYGHVLSSVPFTSLAEADGFDGYDAVNKHYHVNVF